MELHEAFAREAAQDGIALGPRTFDWLCEQGHVGLERVAKACRDPAIVAPVKAALERLAAIHARLKGDESVLTPRARTCPCPRSSSTSRPGP